MPLRRRTLLASAASASLAATAGCTDGFGIGQNDDTSDPPDYARWVPAQGTEQDATFYVYFDVEGMNEFSDLEENLPTSGGAFQETPNAGMESDVDALTAVPAIGALAGGFAFGFGLGVYGFVVDLFDDFWDESAGMSPPGDGPGDGGDAPTPTGESGPDMGTLESMLLAGNAIVLEGSFDTDAVDEAATDEEFEAAGEHQGYRIYEGSGGFFSTGDLAFAAGEDALVFGLTVSSDASFGETPTEGPATGETPTEEMTARGSVEAALDREAGETERMADRSDDAEWALGRAGHGHLVVGAWGESESDSDADSESDDPGFGGGLERTPEALGESDGEVYSLTLADTEMTGEMAAAYPEGETPDREEVESSVGNTADEQEVEIDDTRVSVTGTYTFETDSGEEA